MERNQLFLNHGTKDYRVPILRTKTIRPSAVQHAQDVKQLCVKRLEVPNALNTLVDKFWLNGIGYLEKDIDSS